MSATPPRIETRRHDGEAEVAVVGPLTAGATVESFATAVGALLEEGVRVVRVDLGEVEWVDSAGLGALVRTHTAAGRIGGHLVLRRPSERLLNLLRMARLDEVLEIEGVGE